VKENSKLHDELIAIRDSLLKEFNSLIQSNESQIKEFEGNLKSKEKHVKMTVEDLWNENENNPFTSSILEESMVSKGINIGCAVCGSEGKSIKRN